MDPILEQYEARIILLEKMVLSFSLMLSDRFGDDYMLAPLKEYTENPKGSKVSS